MLRKMRVLDLYFKMPPKMRVLDLYFQVFPKKHENWVTSACDSSMKIMDIHFYF
jgi:hypothetical protein